MARLWRHRRSLGEWHVGREASGTWETHPAPRVNGVGEANEKEGEPMAGWESDHP